MEILDKKMVPSPAVLVPKEPGNQKHVFSGPLPSGLFIQKCKVSAYSMFAAICISNMCFGEWVDYNIWLHFFTVIFFMLDSDNVIVPLLVVLDAISLTVTQDMSDHSQLV